METVFRRFSGQVHSVAFRVLRDSRQAEDVVQVIFLQLWCSAASFHNDRGSLGAWLVVVARNRAIDSLRRRKPTDSVEDVVLVSPFNVAAEAEQNLLMTRVRRILARLPDEQRQPLELAYFEGLSHTAIARRTNVPLGTVKTRIRMALRKLRNAFEA